ncbi:MAG: NUDIX domain-containing protein [Planctomycetota bacterium]
MTRDRDGYRREPLDDAVRVRADIVDAYVFRRRAGVIELLQLHRAGPPLEATWQPVMGHIEPGETPIRTALRELEEEIGLTHAGGDMRAVWALEQVHPYFVPEISAVVLSPRFAVEVSPAFEPRLNEEHTDARWVTQRSDFLWPGQRNAVRELIEEILPEGSPTGERLRIDVERVLSSR